MKFLITIFEDEDGVFIAECPSIPGCVSQGKTEPEAERNIQEAKATGRKAMGIHNQVDREIPEPKGC